jgi:hypothetical protein
MPCRTRSVVTHHHHTITTATHLRDNGSSRAANNSRICTQRHQIRAHTSRDYVQKTAYNPIQNAANTVGMYDDELLPAKNVAVIALPTYL